MGFGRLERTTGDPPMSEINVTPLVDVMLVLVVIFIITAPLLASSIRLELPKAEGTQAGVHVFENRYSGGAQPARGALLDRAGHAANHGERLVGRGLGYHLAGQGGRWPDHRRFAGGARHWLAQGGRAENRLAARRA